MHINCHTAFSFNYGTLSIERLFEEARRCGVHKLALTEINNTASYIEMFRLCEENRPLEGGLNKYGKEGYALEIALGVEFRRNNEFLYLAIARNNAGLEEINRYLSHHNATAKALPDRAPVFDHAFIIYPFQKRSA